MASFRTIPALTVITSIGVFAAMSPATAQTVRATQAAVAPTQLNHGFARCPKSPDQYVMVMKQLVGAARALALAEENPLLEADAAYYEAELASTKTCAPTVANIGPARRSHAFTQPDVV